MSIHARPEPETTAAAPTVHELLVTGQKHAANSETLLGRVVRELDARNRPARITGAYRLGINRPQDRDDSSMESPSVAILNPNPVPVYLGIGGVRPAPNQGALTVPPKAFLVLPISVASFELAIDPTDPNLAGGDAVVHVFRFDAAQTPFLGSA
jgi:hypothetical protein